MADEARHATVAAVGGRYRAVVVALLAGIYVLNFLDRQLLAVLAKPIQDEMGLSDRDLGLLGGLYFALFYSTIAVPIAWLADRTHRVRLLAFACALWSAATAACGLATTYGQLAVARAAVGVGEAGGVPPSYSILADYFGPGERGRALAFFSLGVPLGQALGVAVGATLAAEYHWRTAFLVLGAVGIGAALVLLVSVREPARGRLDAAPRPPRPSRPLLETLAGLARRKDLVVLAAAAAACTVVSYGMLNFLALLLMREKAMSLDALSVWYALVLGVSMAAGMLASGWWVDRFRSRPRWAYAYGPAAAAALAVPGFLAFLGTPDWRLALVYLAVPLCLNAFYLTPALTWVQNSVPADQRATASALLLLVVNLVGLGLGPTYVGALSDARRAAGDVAPLASAFLGLVPVYGIAVALYWYLSRCVSPTRTVESAVAAVN